MKTKLRIPLMFAFLFIVFGCVLATYAQQEQIVGGYGEISVTDAEVVKTANFAIKAQSRKTKAKISLLSIKNAQMQIVSGRNYQLCLQVNYKAKKSKQAVEQFVTVVVYQSLKNKYELTSWTEKPCAEQ